MRVIEVPQSVVAFPERFVGHHVAKACVGHHVATVEDETSGKRYAFVEQWLVPWNTSGAAMVGWGVWDVDRAGNIDFSEMSDAFSEVEEIVQKAGLQRRT
jgi:hypothetical protein